MKLLGDDAAGCWTVGRRAAAAPGLRRLGSAIEGHVVGSSQDTKGSALCRKCLAIGACGSLLFAFSRDFHLFCEFATSLCFFLCFFGFERDSTTVSLSFLYSHMTKTSFWIVLALYFFIVPKVLGVPMPQILDQIVDVPVPQLMEETVEAAKSLPEERIQQRTLEETVSVPVAQIQEQFFAVVKALLNAVQLCSSF